MPKRNSKKSNIQTGRGRLQEVEDEHSDSVSVASSMDDRSVYDGSVYGDQDVEETCVVEKFEEKVDLAMDGTTDKTATTRTNSILSLCLAFCKRYVPELVVERRMTLSDSVERSLRRGKSAELCAAADLAMLMSLQLPQLADIQLVYNELAPTLSVLAANKAVAVPARAKCCTALAFLGRLGGPEPGQLCSHLRLLESIYGEGDAGLLQTTALQAWALLLPDLPSSAIYKLADSEFARLYSLLSAADVELRIAAGEAVALLYELQQRHDASFSESQLEQLCDKLHQLATDSDKSRNRKHRKQQRCSFRDILRTFEDDEFPCDLIKFGREVLHIDCWSTKHMYDICASLLRSGTNVHLCENELVRLLLGLGAPLSGRDCRPSVPRGASKLDRMYQLNETAKFRQQSRSKHRDKRTAVFD